MKYVLKFEDLKDLDASSKILYVNGCSMTYGQELCGFSEFSSVYRPLSQLAPTNYHHHRLERSYAGLIAKTVFPDHVLINDAACGSSNYRIVRRTMHHISQLLKSGLDANNIHVIIGFTSMGRLEVYDKSWGAWNDIHLFMSYDDDVEFKNIADAMCSRFITTESTTQQAMTLIVGLEIFLQRFGIDYTFTNALNVVLDCGDNKDAVIKNPMTPLMDKTKWVKWDDEHLAATGLEWTQSMRNYCLHELKLPVGPRDHPLESSHEAWANLIIDNLKHRGLA